MVVELFAFIVLIVVGSCFFILCCWLCFVFCCFFFAFLLDFCLLILFLVAVLVVAAVPEVQGPGPPANFVLVVHGFFCLLF